MKKLIFLALLLIPSTLLFSQRTIWTTGTARTVPKGEAEFGIVHPLQIGLTDKLEFSTQPLLSLALAPNFGLKKRWYVDDYWMISSNHRYSMPSLLIRAMGESGWFQDLPEIRDSITVPYLFTIVNQGLFTRKLGKELLITGKLGTEFGFKFSSDSMPYLENRFLYPHTAAFNDKFIWNIGIGLDGNIVRQHNFSADFDFYSIGLGIDYWSLEQRAYYIYNHSIKFAVLAGYKLSYSSFPSGNRFAILPVVDLIWKINAKKEIVKDLFRR